MASANRHSVGRGAGVGVVAVPRLALLHSPAPRRRPARAFVHTGTPPKSKRKYRMRIVLRYLRNKGACRRARGRAGSGRGARQSSPIHTTDTRRVARRSGRRDGEGWRGPSDQTQFWRAGSQVLGWSCSAPRSSTSLRGNNVVGAPPTLMTPAPVAISCAPPCVLPTSANPLRPWPPQRARAATATATHRVGHICAPKPCRRTRASAGRRLLPSITPWSCSWLSGGCYIRWGFMLHQPRGSPRVARGPQMPHLPPQARLPVVAHRSAALVAQGLHATLPAPGQLWRWHWQRLLRCRCVVAEWPARGRRRGRDRARRQQ